MGDPLLPRVATTTMPGPSRPTISGLRSTTAGPPRTRRATATLPLLELTLLLASLSLTATPPSPPVTDTDTDMPDTMATATATVVLTDGEQLSPLRLMMCIRSQKELS